MDILPLERVVLELSFHLEFLVEESYGLSGSHLLDLGIDGVLAPFPQDNQAHGLVDVDRGWPNIEINVNFALLGCSSPAI